jgi:protein-S-isoprenylcysteine O-methyltransferase Ste14
VCPTPLALAAPVILALAVAAQVRLVEEPYLLATHGARYREYARTTGRFVPWLGRLANVD